MPEHTVQVDTSLEAERASRLAQAAAFAASLVGAEARQQAVHGLRTLGLVVAGVIGPVLPVYSISVAASAQHCIKERTVKDYTVAEIVDRALTGECYDL